MQIIRVEMNVGKSIVGRITIDELPELLRIQMIDLLNKLAGVKQISIQGKVENAILELADKNVTLDFFDPELRNNFVEAVGLLEWYVAPHWAGSRAIGPSSCAHCGHTPRSCYSIYCTNPLCSSHKMWPKIIGPSYRRREDRLLDSLDLFKRR
jgi:hypothetical protein